MAKKNTTPKAKTARVKREREALVLTDGAGNRLTFVAAQLKDGTFQSSVLHRVDGKNKRGMVDTHGAFVEASARINVNADEALKAGWTKVEKKIRKAKGFETIPAPVNTPAPKPAKPAKPQAA